MHPNPVFKTQSDEMNTTFARERGFGILTVNGGNGPYIAHVPFCLAEDGKAATLHLMRSNVITRNCSQPLPGLIAVSGPDSYISPDWYEVENQVPTWNYTAVHLRGTLTMLEQDALREVLDELSAEFENRLTPKTPWTNDKVTPDALERMMRMIVPFRFEIQSVEGTWKLGQNKPDAARQNAAKQVRAYGIGQDTGMLAALTQTPPHTRNNS